MGMSGEWPYPKQTKYKICIFLFHFIPFLWDLFVVATSKALGSSPVGLADLLLNFEKMKTVQLSGQVEGIILTWKKPPKKGFTVVERGIPALLRAVCLPLWLKATANSLKVCRPTSSLATRTKLPLTSTSLALWPDLSMLLTVEELVAWRLQDDLPTSCWGRESRPTFQMESVEGLGAQRPRLPEKL